MMDCDIARVMRSGTSVGPGIWRNGRPDMVYMVGALGETVKAPFVVSSAGDEQG